MRKSSSDHRVLYFLTDPHHLLKTLRNCVHNSGKLSKAKNSQGCTVRCMTKNGERLEWSTIRRLYETRKGNTARTTYKLNQEDVNLTSYSIMSVARAARVLSRSVAIALRNLKWENSSELATYCETCNDLFDMLNGNHVYHGNRTNNRFFKPYEDVNDSRFEELLNKWKYFEEWNKEVSKLKMKAEEKARRFISAETYQGVERTVKGFNGAVKYLLELGKDSDRKPQIIARVFSQDDLEHYFGKLRAKFGGNRHPNLHEAVQGTTSLYAQSKIAFGGRKRDNTTVNTPPTVEDLSAPLPKRVRRKLDT